MAGTLATTTLLSPRFFNTNSYKIICNSKPISLFSLQNLQPSLTISKSSSELNVSSSLSGKAIAGAVFSTLAASPGPALAAQQLAEIAEGDNRGLALLLPIIPAILWVLYNILGPALNQINRMRSDKGIVVGLGLGGLAASSFFTVPSVSASEIAMIGEDSGDNRGILLLAIVTPTLLRVLYNILQPALSQINRMWSG